MEIERKFLLKRLPDIATVNKVDIYQGYISTDPEVRIRSYEVIRGTNKGHIDYKLTIKGEGDLIREEIETHISEHFFKQLAQFLKKPLIHKLYTKYEHDGHFIECSIVDKGMPSSFIYGEVEFDSINEAKGYKWPFGDAVDITFEKQYKMKNYWLQTRNK